MNALILALLLFQTPAPSLQGVVIRAGTDEPVARATVELRATEATDSRIRTSTTTSDGRFAFYEVPRGQYQLTVTRLGYVRATHGERRPGGPGTPITIPDAPAVRLSMTATAVISGRIVDPQGQPIGNATVSAHTRSYLQGRASPAEVQSVITNDLGEYRLFGLAPGTYYVGANPGPRGVGRGGGTDSIRDFRMQREATRTEPVPMQGIYVSVYYPGTPDSTAAVPIDLKPAAELRNRNVIDVCIEDFNRCPPAEDGTSITPPTLAPDGSFMLQSVPQGTYRVSLSPVLQNGYVKSVRFGNTEGMRTGIAVQGPAELTIVVSARPGTVQGRVLNDRGESVPNARTVLIPDNVLRVRADLFRNALTSPSGEFRFHGLTPGNYKLFAWEEVENGAWLNAEFMRRYEERGVPVVVTESDTGRIEIKVIQN